MINLKENKIKSNNSDNDINLIQEKEKSLDFEKELFLFPVESLIKRIYNRGPDFLNIQRLVNSKSHLKEKILFDLEDASSIRLMNLFEMIKNITFKNQPIIISSVLGLRGINKVTPQPIKIKFLYDNLYNNVSNEIKYFEANNFLMYNGELFNIKEDKKSLIDSTNINEMLESLKGNLHYENDGIILSRILKLFSEEFHLKKDFYKNNENYAELFFRIHRTLESDHALIYYDCLNKKILINRDLFGKRSLIVIRLLKYGVFFFSSNLNLEFYELMKNYPEEIIVFEVPANTVLLIDLENLAFNIDNKESKNSKDILYFSHNSILKFPSELRFNNYNFIEKGNFILFFNSKYYLCR